MVWTNPNVGVKMLFTFTFNCIFFNYIFKPRLGLSIFDPNLGWNNPACFRV